MNKAVSAAFAILGSAASLLGLLYIPLRDLLFDSILTGHPVLAGLASGAAILVVGGGASLLVGTIVCRYWGKHERARQAEDDRRAQSIRTAYREEVDRLSEALGPVVPECLMRVDDQGRSSLARLVAVALAPSRLSREDLELEQLQRHPQLARLTEARMAVHQGLVRIKHLLVDPSLTAEQAIHRTHEMLLDVFERHLPRLKQVLQVE